MSEPNENTILILRERNHLTLPRSPVLAESQLLAKLLLLKNPRSAQTGRQRPFPGAVVAVFEQQCQIEPHACFGNEAAPPRATPLIGDGVMHDAAVCSARFETVLMDEERKRAFHNLIFEQIRVVHRFPAAGPAHGEYPPIPAMQFDQAALLCGPVGFQTDQPQGRRHDHREIGRITVESKHGFRAGIERGAGMENRRHGGSMEYLIPVAGTEPSNGDELIERLVRGSAGWFTDHDSKWLAIRPAQAAIPTRHPQEQQTVKRAGLEYPKARFRLACREIGAKVSGL
jgi:hypothetical protein